MLINKLHQLEIKFSHHLERFNSNEHGIKFVKGYNVITSGQMISIGYERCTLTFICDVCGAPYEINGSSYKRKKKGVESLDTCHSCSLKAGHKRLKDSGKSAEVSKRRVETMKNRDDYSEIIAKRAKSNSDNYKLKSDEYKETRRFNSLLGGNSDARINHTRERFSDTSHLNMKYFNPDRKRRDFSPTVVECEQCSATFNKPYQVAILTHDILCSECSLKLRRINISKGLLRSSIERNGVDYKSNYTRYRSQVYKYTYKNKPKYKKWDNFDKIGLCGVDGAYQLDHIIPIKFGFDNNICPWVIGHIDNLQIIPWMDNLIKGDKYGEIN